jgi:hypothetical protein
LSIEKETLITLAQISPLKESNRVFTEDEAFELIPLLTIITQKAKKEINNYTAQITHMKANEEKTQELQLKSQQSTQMWTEKVKRLGLTPMSLGKVKIPTDNGIFIWEHPSLTLTR